MHTSPLDPRDAEERFAQMLDDAGLPRFDDAIHHVVIQELELAWDHGFSLHLDLTRGDLDPIDDHERAAILGLPVGMEPVHVYVPGDADDPRTHEDIPGIVIHRGPPLHPDDLTVHEGIRCTSPSRTLCDMAESVGIDELREIFAAARDRGLLDPDALRAARGRLEWRPSLPMLDEVIAEFCG